MKHKVKRHPFYVVAGGQVLAGAKTKADAEAYAKLHDSDHAKPRHERPAVFGADFVREVLNVDATDPKAWRDPPKAKHRKTAMPTCPFCNGKLQKLNAETRGWLRLRKGGDATHYCAPCSKAYLVTP